MATIVTKIMKIHMDMGELYAKEIILLKLLRKKIVIMLKNVHNGEFRNLFSREQIFEEAFSYQYRQCTKRILFNRLI